MRLEPLNRICPVCGDGSYMRRLVATHKSEKVGSIDIKCINCNRYFRSKDFEKVVEGNKHMVRAEFEMDLPRECHECRFQLKFKGEDVDDWYTRRCVLINQRIEYPRPDWCPIIVEKE